MRYDQSLLQCLCVQGVSYDPKRLAQALRGRELDLTSRGTKVGLATWRMALRS